MPDKNNTNLAVSFGEGGSASRKRAETEGDNKSLLRFALRFYPLSSKSRLRSFCHFPRRRKRVELYFALQSYIYLSSLAASVNETVGDGAPMSR